MYADDSRPRGPDGFPLSGRRPSPFSLAPTGPAASPLRAAFAPRVSVCRHGGSPADVASRRRVRARGTSRYTAPAPPAVQVRVTGGPRLRQTVPMLLQRAFPVGPVALALCLAAAAVPRGAGGRPAVPGPRPRPVSDPRPARARGRPRPVLHRAGPRPRLLRCLGLRGAHAAALAVRRLGHRRGQSPLRPDPARRRPARCGVARRLHRLRGLGDDAAPAPGGEPGSGRERAATRSGPSTSTSSWCSSPPRRRPTGRRGRDASSCGASRPACAWSRRTCWR